MAPIAFAEGLERPGTLENNGERNENRGRPGHRAGSGRDGGYVPETRAVDGGTGIECRACQTGELSSDLGSEAPQRDDADDRDNPAKADDDTDQFAPAERFMAGDESGEQEHEDRRRRVQDARKTGVDELLAPGEHGPCADAVEKGLSQQHPPGAPVSGQPLVAQPQNDEKEARGPGDPKGDERNRRDLGHRHLEEQVGRAPQQSQ